MQVSYADNIADVERLLTSAQREALPRVTATALNRTAETAQDDLAGEMRRVFDRPTPRTLGGTYIRRATTKRLEVSVAFKDMGRGTPAGKYLQAQVFGGDRRPKRFEAALAARGILRTGEFAVPAPGVRLDRYGNLSGGLIMKILSQLGAQSEVGYAQNATPRSAARNRGRVTYFARRDEGGSNGIYERRGNRVSPVILFVSDVSYTPRLDMDGVLQRAADREFGGYFFEAFEDVFGFSGDGVPF